MKFHLACKRRSNSPLLSTVLVHETVNVCEKTNCPLYIVRFEREAKMKKKSKRGITAYVAQNFYIAGFGRR